MKRIISVLLSLIIITSCTPLAYAEEMGAEFTINAISNTNDASKLTMNVTLPRAVEGGTLIIAFYTDGVCTKVIAKDVSSASTFTLRDVVYSVTPDEIKLMLWEKGRIKPLSSAQNGLTDEVCEKANKKVLELLDDVYPTTNIIRATIGDSDTSQSANEIRVILNAIDSCAAKAKNGGYGQDELLTAEYCKEEFSNELTEIQKIYNDSSQDARDRLINIYNTFLEDEYVEIINNFLGFFNIKILGI